MFDASDRSNTIWQIWTLMLIAGVLVLSLSGPATAGKSRSRTIEYPYVGLGYIELGEVRFFRNCSEAAGYKEGGVCFTPKAEDREMTVQVLDDTGLAIPFEVQQGDTAAVFCSETDKPIRLRRAVYTTITLGVAGCSTPAAPTTGIIRLTIVSDRRLVPPY